MWLTERIGREAGRTVRVSGDHYLVGRAPDCDLKIADTNVSRWHAYFAELPNGEAEVHDLQSANGTWVDGRRIEQARLSGGEQLQFGDTVLLASLTEPRDQQATLAGRPTGSAPGSGALDASAIRRVLRADSAFQRTVRGHSTLQRAVRSSTRRAGLIGAVVASLIAVGALFAVGVLPPGDDAVEEAVSEVGPATILVEAIDDQGNRAATGSGWVLDAHKGLVVTNAHVVNDGTAFRVAAAGRPRPARVVGAAPCEDLALLSKTDTRGLRRVALGSQASLRPGESVVALGYPGNASLDDELTATEGIVSVARTRYREASPDVPVYPNVVQTDAAINPGNSGGPLVDRDGRLVGMNSATRTRSSEGRVIQGQSYAIGVDRVKRVLATLRQGRSIGWLGLGFDYPKATDLRAAGLPEGLFVSRAVIGSPARPTELGREPLLLVGVGRTRVLNTLSSYCQAVRGRRSGEVAVLSVLPPSGGRRPRVVRVPFA